MFYYFKAKTWRWSQDMCFGTQDLAQGQGDDDDDDDNDDDDDDDDDNDAADADDNDAAADAAADDDDYDDEDEDDNDDEQAGRELPQRRGRGPFATCTSGPSWKWSPRPPSRPATRVLV